MSVKSPEFRWDSAEFRPGLYKIELESKGAVHPAGVYFVVARANGDQTSRRILIVGHSPFRG